MTELRGNGDAGDVVGAKDTMQGTLVRLLATEAQLRERTTAARNSDLSLAAERRDNVEMSATLAATRRELDARRAMLQQTRAALDQTCAALDQTRATLDDVQARLGGDLAAAEQELARISGSARQFLRGYLPKLLRHLWRRLSPRPDTSR